MSPKSSPGQFPKHLTKTLSSAIFNEQAPFLILCRSEIQQLHAHYGIRILENCLIQHAMFLRQIGWTYYFSWNLQQLITGPKPMMNWQKQAPESRLFQTKVVRVVLLLMA